MGTVKLLLIVCALGFAFHWWNGRGDGLANAPTSPNGFVSVVMPDGAEANTVVILAPVDCPSDAAQRADALSRELTRLGIRNVRSNSFSANIADPNAKQQAGIERAFAVLNGQIPAVFVNGMGKANPTAAEVVSEYRGKR
jgi:hypothetical protein